MTTRRFEPPWTGVDRRRFLTYLVAAPTLTIAARFGLHRFAPAAARAQVLPPGGEDAILEITEDNRVVLRMRKSECGQGIATALAMLVAEELDARLDDVAPELAALGSTHGSTSMTDMWGPIRQAAAAARARLVTAAAELWGLDASSLETPGDTHVHAPDGRRASYGSLSAAAAGVTEPAVSPDPKPYSEHRVIGTPTTRLDARAIVTGKAVYAMDVEVPGALPTVVARPPTIGGTVASVDDTEARAMPGVVAVTTIPSGVAVSADSFDRAIRAREALRIVWNPGEMGSTSDADVREQLALLTPVPSVPAPSGSTVEGFFDFAFVSHAPMEVLNAIADVRSDGADVWVATQIPNGVRKSVAGALGLPEEAVTVHLYPSGGAFGRRLYHEHTVEAAEISRELGAPVRLMWTRDDDMRHGRVRPASHHRIRAVFSGDTVLEWDHQAAGVQVEWPDLMPDVPGFPDLSGNIVHDTTIGQVAWRGMTRMPYDFGVVTSGLAELRLPIPTGTWRAVYAGQARTAEEVLLDELAEAMGKDPVAFRLEHLRSARARAVLERVAEAGSWGRSMEPGFAQGVGVQEEFGSATACLVEIDARDPNAPRLTRAVIAVDVGLPVNPSGVEAQVMGAAMDGFATVLETRLHLEGGAIREGNFLDHRWTRQRHAPREWEIFVMPASGQPGGLGELGVPSAAGAAANAYARAAGTRVRSFPILA